MTSTLSIHHFVFLVLVIFTMNYTTAQICTGNLGENIFLDGDFGAGRANVLAQDRGIAPGYRYQRNPPPDDGFYTITNNTTNWGSFAWTWDNITDNSPDPLGYMMIVNASFSPGIFYQQQVDGLCENTLYQFTVDVYNLVNAIRPNISFQLNGVTQYESGPVPYNRKWNTYGFTFTTRPGQTSVTLAIRNNALGGQGNDLALDNISFRACGPEALILPTEIANVCEDGNPIDLDATILGNQYGTPTYQWQESLDGGLSWTDIPGGNTATHTHTKLSAGIYYYRYLLANNSSNLQNTKCRVISNTKIVHVVPKFYNIIDTICEGSSYFIGDRVIQLSGIYQDSQLTQIGCDSIVTLNLTVLNDPNISVDLKVQDPSCSYSDDGSIDLLTVNNGYDPFTVSTNGVENPRESIGPIGAGDYIFEVVDRYGCSTDTVITIIAPPPFTVDLGSDQELDLGDEVTIEAFFKGTPSSIRWNDGSIESCNPSCNNLTFTPITTQNVIIEATSDNNCLARDTIQLTVNKVENIFMPNVISPNGDLINDFFTVMGKTPNVQRVQQLSIYSRWGDLVFFKENFPPNESEEGWNGRDRNDRFIPGVYTFIAQIELFDGSIVTKTGDLTLVE